MAAHVSKVQELNWAIVVWFRCSTFHVEVVDCSEQAAIQQQYLAAGGMSGMASHPQQLFMQTHIQQSRPKYMNVPVHQTPPSQVLLFVFCYLLLDCSTKPDFLKFY